MNNYPDDKIDQWVKEAKSAAHFIEHEWDRANVDWPGINADSHVFEIGSYKGRWALQIAQRYNPYLFCFEPQLWAYETTCAVLRDYRAMVFNFGLGVATGKFAMIEYGTDGCKLVPYETLEGHNEVLVDIRNIVQVVADLEVPQIDLALINIEGYEYTLIPHMFKNGIYPRAMSVQFHKGNYEGLRRQIEANYRVLWDYGQTLVGFALKETV